MRADQFERLQLLQTKLVERALFDCDPDNWSGAGMKAADMTRDQRGDAHWSRKISVGTLSVLTKVVTLIGTTQGSFAAPPSPEDPVEEDLDAEIATAEREAAALLDQVQQSARKVTFDKRARGKRR